MPMPMAAHVHPASGPAAAVTVTDEQVHSSAPFSSHCNQMLTTSQIVDEDRDKWRAEAAKWSEHKAEEEGTFYYYNSDTGASVWECPPALALQKELDSAGFVM